jgi:hypothetical protein
MSIEPGFMERSKLLKLVVSDYREALARSRFQRLSDADDSKYANLAVAMMRVYYALTGKKIAEAE